MLGVDDFCLSQSSQSTQRHIVESNGEYKSWRSLKSQRRKPLLAKTSELVFAQRLPSFVPIVSIGTSPNLWEVLSDQSFFELSEGCREPAGGNGCDNLTIDSAGGIR